MPGMEWVVEQPFREGFSGNLAVFCSDERFVSATLEFLRYGLNIERCDLLVLPGGPAFIAEKNTAFVARVKFLLEHHNLKRILLITHEDCGHYKAREKGRAAHALHQQQDDEVRAAARLLAQECPGVRIEAFMVKREAAGFVFSHRNAGGE